MDPSFINWLKHHKLEAYVSTFNEAGYLSGADSGLAVLSEEDALCVAVEEMCMNAEDAAIFVAMYKTCADPLPAADASPGDSSLVKGQQPGATVPEEAAATAAYATLGVSLRVAFALLECLPTAVFGRMALANRAWQELVNQQLATSSTVRRSSVYAARLNAAVASRAVATAAKLLLEAPNALSNLHATHDSSDSSAEATAAREMSQAVAAARAAQRAWALEDQALSYVATAVASGAADAAAAAALEEALALGLHEHASVRELQQILSPPTSDSAANAGDERNSNEYELSFGPSKLGFGIKVGSPTMHQGLPVVSKAGSYPFPAQGHVLLSAFLNSGGSTGDASSGGGRQTTGCRGELLWPARSESSIAPPIVTSRVKEMAASAYLATSSVSREISLVQDCENHYDALIEVLANPRLRPVTLRFLATDGLVPPPPHPPSKLATFTSRSRLPHSVQPPAVHSPVVHDGTATAIAATTTHPAAGNAAAESDQPETPGVSKLTAFIQSAPSSTTPTAPASGVSKLSAFMTSVTPPTGTSTSSPSSSSEKPIIGAKEPVAATSVRAGAAAAAGTHPVPSPSVLTHPPTTVSADLFARVMTDAILQHVFAFGTFPPMYVVASKVSTRWRSIAACPRHATVSSASVQGLKDPTAAIIGLLNSWTKTAGGSWGQRDSRNSRLALVPGGGNLANTTIIAGNLCQLRHLTLDQAPLGRYSGAVLAQVLEKCPLLSHLAVVGAPLALNQTIHSHQESSQRGKSNEGAALDFSALAIYQSSGVSASINGSSSSSDGHNEEVTRTFGALQHLKFEGRQLLGLEALVKRAPHLVALTVKRCPHFNDADLEQIAALMDEPSDGDNSVAAASSIKTASLSSPACSSLLPSAASHQELQRPLQKLQTLTVAACAEVTDAGLLALLGFPKNDNARRHQAPQLLLGLPALTKLDASGCPLVGSRLGTALAGHALAHHQRLSQSNSSSSSKTDFSLTSTSLPLGLREFDLRGCKAFTDAAAHATADALVLAPSPVGSAFIPATAITSTTVGRTAVQLPWRWLAVGAPGLNSIGDSGLQRLAAACSHSLVHLSVAAAEHVTGTGLATALAPLLDPRKGGILRCLELHWCPLLRDQDAASLVALASGGPSDNMSLQRLSLRHCKRLSDACAPLVFKVLLKVVDDKKARPVSSSSSSSTISLDLDLRDTRATPKASAQIEAQSGGFLKIAATIA